MAPVEDTTKPKRCPNFSNWELEDLHSASKATVFKKKQTKKPTKENISELLSGNKLWLSYAILWCIPI